MSFLYNIKFFYHSQQYIKAAIFCFSYYQYTMNCPELKTEVIRKDSDFYFLRDNLLKLFPATIVSN